MLPKYFGGVFIRVHIALALGVALHKPDSVKKVDKNDADIETASQEKSYRKEKKNKEKKKNL